MFLVRELVRRLNWVLYRVPADSLAVVPVVPVAVPGPVPVVPVPVVVVVDGWISLNAWNMARSTSAA